MLAKDVAGIFSRFFISGFFLPAFFTLFVLWLTVSPALEPAAFKAQDKGVQVLVLGGVALLIGLLLQGLRFPLIQTFEGYGIRSRILLRPLHWIAMPMQRRAYRRIERQAGEEEWMRKWKLDRRFPLEMADLLPTRFGNVFAAYERYPDTRYGLDMIAIYPRIDQMLRQREQELHWNAYTDVMLFMNLTVGASAFGVIFVTDRLLHDSLDGWTQIVYGAPFVLAYLLYRFSVGAAERLGTERRASVDLHRLELYAALNVRVPLTAEEEREKIAPAVNALLLYGDALPDDVISREVSAPEDSPGEPRPPKPKPKPKRHWWSR